MLVINYKGNKPQQRFYTLGVIDNNNANKIRFVLEQAQNLINLSGYQWYLKVQNKDHDYHDKIMLENPIVENGTITLDWLLTRKSTQFRNLELQLEYHSASGDIVWQTMIVELEMNETIKTDEEISEKYPTELEQMEELVEGYDERIRHIEETSLTQDDIIDNCESENPHKVLSAKQGKVLNDKVNTAISGVMRYKGSVQTYADLPTEDLEVGDVYNVIADDSNYAWTGEEWDMIGSAVDTSNLVDKTSNQEITGIKTFTNQFRLKYNANDTELMFAKLTPQKFDIVNLSNNATWLSLTASHLTTTNIYPKEDDSYDIGSAVKCWANIYLSNSIVFNDDHSWNWIKIKDVGVCYFKPYTIVAYNIEPPADAPTSADYYIGTQSKRFGTFYGKDVNLSGTFNITSNTNTLTLSNAGNYIALQLGSKVLCSWGSGGLNCGTTIYPETSGKDLGTSANVWQSIYVDNLTNGTGDLTSHCNLIPSARDCLDFGSSTKQWRNLYMSGKLYMNNGYSVYGWSIEEDTNLRLLFKFSQDGQYDYRLCIDNGFTYSQSLYPKTNNAQDLGATSWKWRNIYMSGSLRDGNNNDYGLVLPDTTNWTADKTIATTDQLGGGITITTTTGSESISDGTNTLNVATRDTAQTYTALKTFNFNVSTYDAITFANTTNVSYTIGRNGNELRIKYNTLEALKLNDDVLTIKNLKPFTTNTYDLGASNNTWKDLYLSGSINGNGTNNLDIKNGTTTLRIQPNGYVASDYFIPLTDDGGDLGISTNRWRDLYLSGAIKLSKAGETTTWELAEQSGGSLLLKRSGTGIMSFASSYFSSYDHRPIANNTYDLGTSTNAWKDIYLAGVLSDGTNSVSVSKIATTNTTQEINGSKTFRGSNLLRVSANGWNTKWAFNFDTSANLSVNYLTNNDTSTTHYVFGRTTGFYPATSGSKSLGTESAGWTGLYLNENNGNYVWSITHNSSDNNIQIGIKASGGSMTAQYNFTQSALRPSTNQGKDLGSASYYWNNVYATKLFVSTITDGLGNDITPEQLYYLGKAIQGLAQPNAVNLNNGDTLTDYPTLVLISQRLPFVLNSSLCYFLTEDTNYYVYTTHYFDSSTLDVVPYKVIINKTTYVVSIATI